MDNPCVSCRYAKMRRDICGIYCTGGFLAKDGECDHYENWRERRKAKNERTVQKQSVHGQASLR